MKRERVIASIAKKLSTLVSELNALDKSMLDETNLTAKRCVSCSNVLPIDEFQRNHTQRGGRASSCKNCICQRQKKSRNSDYKFIKQVTMWCMINDLVPAIVSMTNPGAVVRRDFIVKNRITKSGKSLVAIFVEDNG